MVTVRIVHVSDCYAPRVGGIESQVQDLATFQAARDDDTVHVLTATALARGTEVVEGRNRYRASATEAPGLRVHRLASRTTMGVPVHPRGYWLIRRALRMLRPDVVHVHAGVVSPFAYDGARAVRSLGLPMAITWHCMLDGVEPLVAAGARAARWRSAAFAPSAVSAVAATRVADALGRDDVSVLPNGLDLQPWTDAAAHPAPNAHPGTLRLVATQRLAPRKRTLPLLDLVGRASDRLGRDENGRPRVHLTLVGGGPAEPQVRAEVRAAGLEDVVTVMGVVPRAVLPTLYRDQDVFLSPAVLEAFGVAALEGRASGLAVVGRTGTGLPEFVTDGVHGFLGDTDAAMEEAVVELATRPELLARIRATNAAAPPTAGWSDVLGTADTLYERAQERAGTLGAGAATAR